MAGLTLTGVRKAFGGATILHHINLEVRDGEFMVFVGPYLYEQKYLWGDFAAAAVLSGLPITLVFLAAQKWIVSGLTAGA